MTRSTRAARRRGEAVCVYCGSKPATTQYHVLSRGFYVPPYPANLFTVPACHECNQAKSRNEDILRDFLTIDLPSASAPEAKALFQTTVARSIARRSAAVAQQLVWQGCRIPLYSPGASLSARRSRRSFRALQ